MLMRMMPLDVMVPTTGGLTLTLPASGLTEKTHNPFGRAVTIAGIKDEVVIMSSLQRPKKVRATRDHLCVPSAALPSHLLLPDGRTVRTFVSLEIWAEQLVPSLRNSCDRAL